MRAMMWLIVINKQDVANLCRFGELCHYMRATVYQSIVVQAQLNFGRAFFVSTRWVAQQCWQASPGNYFYTRAFHKSRWKHHRTHGNLVESNLVVSGHREMLPGELWMYHRAQSPLSTNCLTVYWLRVTLSLQIIFFLVAESPILAAKTSAIKVSVGHVSTQT